MDITLLLSSQGPSGGHSGNTFLTNVEGEKKLWKMPKVARNKTNIYISWNWYMLQKKCKKCLEVENIPLTDLLAREAKALKVYFFS